MISLPARVQIREVGPRDGFQNEPENIPTGEKIRLIEALGRTGVGRMEVASFVRPDAIPQLADGVAVLSGLSLPADVDLRVLIPNLRGLETALTHRDRFHEVAVFVSASETHNRKNVNRSIEQSLGELKEMLPIVNDAGLRSAAAIATSFGCPYEGRVDSSQTLEMARRLADAGARELVFGDTTGMANPKQVAEFFEGALGELDGVEVTAHFHNTRGQGLANVLAALDTGITSFEASFGELGGCPVPPGSTGNVCTEDLVSMLHEMGVETGIDLPALVDTTRAVRTVLGRPLTSHVLTAGLVEWAPERPDLCRSTV